MSIETQYGIVAQPEQHDKRTVIAAMSAVRREEAARLELGKNLNPQFWASEVGQHLVKAHRYVYGDDDLIQAKKAAGLVERPEGWLRRQFTPHGYQSPRLLAFCVFKAAQKPFVNGNTGKVVEAATAHRIRCWLQTHRDLIWQESATDLRDMMIAEWRADGKSYSASMVWVRGCLGELRPLAEQWYISRVEVLKLAEGEKLK